MSESTFNAEIESLSPEDFRDYFFTRTNVVYPELPKPTGVGRANADAVLKNCFELIGEVIELEDGFSWQPKRTADKEWQIAHHKFYFAVDLIHAWRETGDATYLKKWISLIDSWLHEMDSGFIAASDAQVEAKRIEHWIYSFALLQGTGCQAEIPPEFLKRFLSRIATETDYITHHLKRTRNHRTFQLFSVVLTGVLFPEFKLHETFLKTGIEKLSENLLTDILTDGVHVEQSSHYHQLVMETAIVFVELTRINGISLDKTLLERIHSGLRFSMWLQWPSGDIPLFNEADNGDHLALLQKGGDLFQDEHLLWAGTLGKEGTPPVERSKHFDQSGYFVLGDHWGRDEKSYRSRQHVFYDCGRLGEGSHSHYDLFNFCYFTGGQAVLIDPGRYTYVSEPDENGVDWRRYFKSTASHNTVTIDGKDQTRYISREERKQRQLKEKHGPEVALHEKDFMIGKRSDWVTGEARSAEYAPRHRRTFVFMLKDYLFIFDRIDMVNDTVHRADLHFHLTDELFGQVALEQKEAKAFFRSPWVEIRSDCGNDVKASIETGWISRQYGVKAEAPVVKLSQTRADTAYFATVVAQAAGCPEGAVVTSFKRLSRPEEPFLRYQAEGMAGGAPFVDQFVFAKSGESEVFQSEAFSFRGRFLACRARPDGQTTYIIGQDISGISIQGDPELQISGGERFEWTRKTK